jgi:Peptidase C39 family
MISKSLKIGIASLALVGVVVPPTTVANKPFEPDQVLIDAQKAPKDFIAKNAESKDVKVQTAVTRARMTSAYESAKKKDFVAARTEFIEASYKHKGTDAMNPDFGTLSDQAAYQAIVCLDAAGKDEEAKLEFRKFIRERQLSPLITACSRRLERLTGNKLLPEDEALLQDGIAAQEKKIAFETSVCGPKCLERVLPLFGKAKRDYLELAKLCGTDGKGTSIEGLKKGSETLGLEPIGFELNALDFSKMSKPFIWLQVDHYIAVLLIKGGKMFTFDPRYKQEAWFPIPDTEDAKFRAQVLAFEVPTAELTGDVTKPSKAATEKPALGAKK